MSTTTADDRITSYTPVFATTEFAADFPVFDNGDLIVIHDGEKRTDFTVSATYFEGISNNAKAVFATGIIGEVLVVGARSPRRVSRFTNGSPVPIWQQNLVADILTAQAQEDARGIRLAVKLPLGADGNGYEIQPGIQDGALLAVKDGRIEQGPDSESVFEAAEQAAQAAGNFAGQAAGSAANAAQSASAAAVSEANAADSATDSIEASDAAQALVIAATAGFAGFIDGMIYDFGSVADPITYFDQDWGFI